MVRGPIDSRRLNMNIVSFLELYLLLIWFEHMRISRSNLHQD